MSNICILITSEYPYKTQETFIEDEIHFLAKEFDRIQIFSLDILSEEKKRSLPANVFSTPIGTTKRGSKLRFPRYVANGLLHRPFFKEKTDNLKQYLMKTYISGKSQAEYTIILKHLQTLLQSGDHVCIYSYWFFNHAMIACRLKKQLLSMGYTVKAYSRAHRYDIYSENHFTNYIPYHRPMLRMLDGVYSCSEDGRQYMLNKYGREEFQDKLHVSRLGTLEHGLSMQTDFSELHFVTCSRLAGLKRVSLFANAFVLFHQKLREMQNNADPSLSPLLAGIDPDRIHWTCMGDGEEAELVKNIIGQAGLKSQFTFTGTIAHDDVMQFYSDHPVTFFFNVSTSEGVPVSIMEAQSFGIPVIATDVGGTAEIVNEANGHLLELDLTPERLCQVMLEECSEENIRRKQKQSRADWEKNSFADVLYSQWCGFLGDSVR